MEPITNAQCHRLLAEEPVGHLGVQADDEPYVTPISFVHMNDAIYLRTGPGRRLTALLAGERCCVEVSRYSNDQGDWESVLLWGTAEVVDESGEEADAIGLLLEAIWSTASATCTIATCSASPVELREPLIFA